MEERYNWKKELRVAFVMLLIIVIFIIGIKAYAVKFLPDHPTYYKYEDDWIIGKTQEQIEERYGEMDMSFDGYCMGYDIDVYDFWGHLLWDPAVFRYYIIADEDGVARDIVAGSAYVGPLYDYTEEEGLLKRIFFIFGISFY